MKTRTRSSRIAAMTAAAAITTTFAVQSATATAEPPSERPCFIAQPRWNAAIDGPPPSCPVPTWQRQPGSHTDTDTQRAGSGTSNRMEFGDEYAGPRR